MAQTENPFEDIGIRFGAQDVEWLLSSIDLMLATGLAAGASDEARERMRMYRDQLSLQSALPAHSGSYKDAFDYNDALAAVRESDAWEACLSVDEKSYFKDCRLVIETHREGERSRYKLTSDLRLGHDSDHTALDKYGVYLNRLVEACQSVAPATSVQIDERTVKVVADWRAFLEKDEKAARKTIAAIVLEGVVTDDIKGPFVIRKVGLAPWTETTASELPEHLRYLDVAVSASAEGHARLQEFVAGYNEEIKSSAQIIPLRVG